MILKAKPGIDLEDLSDNDLIRLCADAVAEHEGWTTPEEVAGLVRDIRAMGGPSFTADGLEIDAACNVYFLVDTDIAEEMAKDCVEEFAYDQYREVKVQLDRYGINSSYVQFDTDMYIRDCMLDWGQWLSSYNGTVNEYFPKTQYNGKVENFGCFSIWQTG